MARFRIDDADIDVEALEARVEAAIAAKRGKRFTDRELEELRSEPLRPRLRREDLPRGLLEEVAEVRGRLADVPPAPGSRPASASSTREDRGGEAPPLPDPASLLFATASTGLKGRVLGLLRRLARPGYRATLNLEHTLAAMRDEIGRLRNEIAGERDYVESRLERSFDLLKDNLDDRIDATADWSGQQLSELVGALERRHERQIHLMHNLVYELTNVRVDLQQMQDRLNEVTRRIDALGGRQRALEEITLPKEPDA